LLKKKELYTLIGHNDLVLSCYISTDNKFIVSTSADETLKIWDVASGKEINTLNGHSGWIYSCCISTDNKFIVSASQYETLQIWDVASGKKN